MNARKRVFLAFLNINFILQLLVEVKVNQNRRGISGERNRIADILANKLPYRVENENGFMGNSICLEANGEKAKFEKRSRSKKKSKNKRNTKRRKYGKD